MIALILVAPAFPQKGIGYGIPNDALAALVLPAGSQARSAINQFVPALTALESLTPYDIALVALEAPFTMGVIASVPHPEDLLTLSQAGLSSTPLHHRLVAVGDQNFVARLKESRPIPRWIRLRASISNNQHDGTLLFAQNTDAPWLLGSIDMNGSTARLLAPLPARVRQTPRALESDLQETLFDLVRLLLPAASSLRLPDNTIVQELRQEASALSWSIEEKDGPTYTLLQNNKPVLFYERLREKDGCSDKPAPWEVAIGTYPPLPELKLEISLLKRAILFCIANGDKL